MYSRARGGVCWVCICLGLGLGLCVFSSFEQFPQAVDRSGCTWAVFEATCDEKGMNGSNTHHSNALLLSAVSQLLCSHSTHKEKPPRALGRNRLELPKEEVNGSGNEAIQTSLKAEKRRNFENKSKEGS